MAFIPATDVVQAELRYTWDSQEVENLLYFKGIVAVSFAMMVSLGSALSSWWSTNLQPIQSNTVTLREIYLRRLNALNDIETTQPAPTINTGALVAPSLPNSNTIAVSFRTSMTGRSFRGRNYFIGLTEADVTANAVSTTRVNSLIDAYEALMTTATGANFEWVVLSRYSGVDANGDPIPRAAGVATLITTVVVKDATIDSQRRRLPGRGT